MQGMFTIMSSMLGGNVDIVSRTRNVVCVQHFQVVVPVLWSLVMVWSDCDGVASWGILTCWDCKKVHPIRGPVSLANKGSLNSSWSTTDVLVLQSKALSVVFTYILEIMRQNCVPDPPVWFHVCNGTWPVYFSRHYICNPNIALHRKVANKTII